MTKSFTLIELLVVILIISLISTVVSVNVIKHIRNARITSTKAALHTIKTGLLSFKIETGRFPEKLEDLIQRTDERWNGPYLDCKEVPQDAWHNAFRYSLQDKKPSVVSSGEDQEFDTEDDIKL